MQLALINISTTFIDKFHVDEHSLSQRKRFILFEFYP